MTKRLGQRREEPGAAAKAVHREDGRPGAGVHDVQRAAHAGTGWGFSSFSFRQAKTSR